MPINPDKYFAFFTAYSGITNELTTPAGVIPMNTDDAALRGVPVAVKALWDTGATMSCIKPALWERLKLRPLTGGRIELAGVGGRVTSDVTIVNLLPMPDFELEIEDCPVYVTDFPGDADILIGMDIIGMGDFAVCNAENKTSFSFAVPPFPARVDFAAKAEAANRRGACE